MSPGRGEADDVRRAGSPGAHRERDGALLHRAERVASSPAGRRPCAARRPCRRAARRSSSRRPTSVPPARWAEASHDRQLDDPPRHAVRAVVGAQPEARGRRDRRRRDRHVSRGVADGVPDRPPVRWTALEQHHHVSGQRGPARRGHRAADHGRDADCSPAPRTPRSTRPPAWVDTTTTRARTAAWRLVGSSRTTYTAWRRGVATVIEAPPRSSRRSRRRNAVRPADMTEQLHPVTRRRLPGPRA